MFDEFVYNAPDGENASTIFELRLDNLLECLNIFGSGFASVNSGSEPRSKRLNGNDSDDERGPNGNGRIDHYFQRTSDSKHTGMRMSYAGPGHPLVLLMCAIPLLHKPTHLPMSRSEDAAGPKTTCRITTLEPGDGLNLDFDDERKWVSSTKLGLS